MIQCTAVSQRLLAQLPQRGLEAGLGICRRAFLQARIRQSQAIPGHRKRPYGALNRLMTWLHVMSRHSSALAGTHNLRTVGGASSDEHAPHQRLAAPVIVGMWPISAQFRLGPRRGSTGASSTGTYIVEEKRLTTKKATIPILTPLRTPVATSFHTQCLLLPRSSMAAPRLRPLLTNVRHRTIARGCNFANVFDSQDGRNDGRM